MLKFPEQLYESILLPIKPVYVDKILSGEKTVEFRKVVFKQPVKKLIIYSSSPVKKVVAICNIKRVRVLTPDLAWYRYKSVGGISKSAFYEYYKSSTKAVSIELVNIRILSIPIDIKLITGSSYVPQSYQYLSIDQTKTIELMSLSEIVI